MKMAVAIAGFTPGEADQLRRAKDEHSGAPLAIWLGMVLDGIPESFVIGAGLLVLVRVFTRKEPVEERRE